MNNENREDKLKFMTKTVLIIALSSFYTSVTKAL